MRNFAFLLGFSLISPSFAKEHPKTDWVDLALHSGEISVYTVGDEKQSLAMETCHSDFATIEKNQYILMEKLDSMRLKIDHLEKQQRDFLSLISDIVMKPSNPAVAQEHSDYQTNLDLMKAQQYPQALKLWKKFIQHYPSSEKTAYAYYWMGELYASEGKPESAKECYQYLIDQYPTHVKTPEAFFKIGQLEIRQGHKEKAVFLFKTVVKQYPLSQVTFLAKKILKDIAPEETEESFVNS